MANISFKKLVSVMQREFPGRVTVVPSYERLKSMLDCGDARVWDLAETLTLARAVREHGTPGQQRRLREEITASRWSTEIMRTEEQ
jgi:hypothetical protein